MSDLIESLHRMQGKKILVIGDMIADIYLDGRIARISREAPVLVLEQQKEVAVPGGAANVVHNAATLGGSVYAVGVIGGDKQGELLRGKLNEVHVDTGGLICAADRLTISKTRVIAGGAATVSQQVVRIDRETKEPLPMAIEAEIGAVLRNLLVEADGVVMSDYGSHTITKSIIRQVIEYCDANKIPNIVDTRYDLDLYTGVQYVKQNEAEAAAAVGFALDDENKVMNAGEFLLRKLRAKGILLTRGSQGMTLFEAGKEAQFIPVSNRSEVFDVSGAGDTAVAAMILALAAGIAPFKAARLANYASGIAVRKQGTAAVTAAELQQVIGGAPC